MSNNIWIDTRLNEETMKFLNDAISEKNLKKWNHSLTGHISKSELINDKDNWFFNSSLKQLTEKMFYRDWINFSMYHIEGERPFPEFEVTHLWVNYQKQYEFNPSHSHTGLYSFVVFMKIPTHWKEQHKLPISENSNHPQASDFQFLLGQGTEVQNIDIALSPEDEGRIIFFPAWLKHQVYPFYGTEEERITISGNISLYQRN
jgi:hypothetical protein